MHYDSYLQLYSGSLHVDFLKETHSLHSYYSSTMKRWEIGKFHSVQYFMLWMTWDQGINRHGTDLITTVSHPGIPGGLNVFVLVRMPPPAADSCSRDNFEQLFGFLSFLHDCWPWPLDYLIRFWLIFHLDLEFSRSNMEFAISQPKMVRSRSNMEFAISQPKMVRLPWSKKQTHRLNSRPQMWPSGLTLAMTLTLNFQGQIWNLPYICQKLFDCHETKSKNIDWTLGLKCDHRVWPWPWPWPLIFKVKYGIGFGDNTDLLWWNNVNNQFCQLTTRVL